MENFGVPAGVGALSSVAIIYLVNNKITPIKEDVERLVKEVGEMINQKEDIEMVKIDVRDLIKLNNEREKKMLSIIDSQDKKIESLMETIIDLQTSLYREISLKTKKIPAEYLPNKKKDLNYETNPHNTHNTYNTIDDKKSNKSNKRNYEKNKSFRGDRNYEKNKSFRGDRNYEENRTKRDNITDYHHNVNSNRVEERGDKSVMNKINSLGL